jgi:hypothetical protein
MDTASNASNNYISDELSETIIDGGNDFNDFDSSSMDSSYRRHFYNEHKIVDKGHHTVMLQSGKNQKFRVSFYETAMTPGNMIRNAVTGERYTEYRVGSSAEDLFYTVCYSVGNTGSRNPCILFFETPGEYEYMFRVKLSEKALEDWKSKMMYERDRRQELESSQKKTVVK